MTVDPASRLTSPRTADSANTNPVVVRRIMRLLARAGLVRIRRGQGGAMLRREADRITLDDVWHAMNPAPAPPLLPLHARPDPTCPVGSQMPWLLAETFLGVERAMREALADTSIADMMAWLGHRAGIDAAESPGIATQEAK